MIVQLDEEERYLCYEKETSVATFLDNFKPKSRVPVDDIVSFVYGGLSSTFKKYESDNNRNLRKERQILDGEKSNKNYDDNS